MPNEPLAAVMSLPLLLMGSQRLPLDVSCGSGDGTARQRAEALPRERCIPVMLAERFQRAVDRASRPA